MPLRETSFLLPELAPNGDKVLRIINLGDFSELPKRKLESPITYNFLTDGAAIYHTGVYRRKKTISAQSLDFIRGRPGGGPDGEKRDYAWHKNDILAWGGMAQTEDAILLGTLSRGRFLALDKETGAVKWEFKGQGSAFATPVLDGDAVIYGDNKGNIYRLRISDGALMAKAQLGAASSKASGSATALPMSARGGECWPPRTWKKGVSSGKSGDTALSRPGRAFRTAPFSSVRGRGS